MKKVNDLNDPMESQTTQSKESSIQARFHDYKAERRARLEEDEYMQRYNQEKYFFLADEYKKTEENKGENFDLFNGVRTWFQDNLEDKKQWLFGGIENFNNQSDSQLSQ